MLVGQVMIGGWVSFTVTVKLHVAVFVEVSVAVQLTVLVPFANVEPLAGAQLAVTPGQLSLTVAVQMTLDATQVPAVVFVTIFAGQVIVGGVPSEAVPTVIELLAEQPLASCTVTV